MVAVNFYINYLESSLLFLSLVLIFHEQYFNLLGESEDIFLELKNKIKNKLKNVEKNESLKIKQKSPKINLIIFLLMVLFWPIPIMLIGLSQLLKKTFL
jgi:hypothetical protein